MYSLRQSSLVQSDIDRLFEVEVDSLFKQIVEPLVARRMQYIQTLFVGADDTRDVTFHPEE